MDKETCLQSCIVEGLIIKLPNYQLDRKVYQEVAKSLELIGGKWKGGKVAGFVFNEDPTDLLAQIAGGESRNLKKEYQFYATPPAIADWLVELAGIKPDHKILEPSAGQGAIINAINRVLPAQRVYWCELMPVNQTFIRIIPLTCYVDDDYINSCGLSDWDRIIANPPFSKNQDIHHVYKMYADLKPGGRLVSVVSKHWQNCDNKLETEFRNWLTEVDAETHEIEAGAFKESGTMISSIIIVVNKPETRRQPVKAGTQIMNANFKTFQAWLNRSTNTLPILDNMKVENNVATISDLETSVQFDTDLKDGYYAIKMNEPFFIKELNKDYPLLPVDAGTFSAQAVVSASLLIKFVTCTANDELRPVMNGIYMSAKQIAASDAHVLRRQSNFANRIDENFDAIIPMVVPLLTRCKSNPSELITIDSFEDKDNRQHLRFTFSDCTIITRATEGKYPNFESVIPTGRNQKCFSLPVSVIQEMAKTAKSFKAELTRISDTGIIIENIDLKLKKEWPTPTIVTIPSRKPDGVIMPMMVQDVVSEDPGFYNIGLNALKIAQLITLFKGNVIVGFSDPSRAFCVWYEPSDQPAVTAHKVVSHRAASAPVTPKLVVVHQPAQAKAIEAHATPVPPVHEEPKKSETPRPAPVKQQQIVEFVIVHYSEKSVALFGNTISIKEKLMELHGVFNRHLKYNDQPASGWVFSKKREAAIRQLIAS